MNVYKQESPIKTFNFKILPPWYRSILTYTGFFISFVTLLYCYIRFRIHRINKEKQHLEILVEQRTREIKEKNIQLEEQTRLLTLQAEQLKEMDKVKSRFFATISHEFRTPLTLIMGPLEHILSHSSDIDLKNKAELMLRNSERLLGLINQLLDLSRLHSGKMRLLVMRKNIIPFIRGIIASFKLLAEQRQLLLHFNTPHEDISLYFNPENVEQILCNLLSNAVKNTPTGGSITVSAQIDQTHHSTQTFPEGFLRLTVTDTGTGIPQDQLQHIFELFYQVQSSYGHSSKGSGIGLSLTRELVQLHYGDIQVQSMEGKGTEFTVHLPLGKSHLKPEEIIDATQQHVIGQKTESCISSLSILETREPEPQEIHSPGPDEPLPTPTDSEKPIILIVEDNADLRRYLYSAFETAYRVFEACDGKEGWEKAAQLIPDIIVSDVIMPHIDGFELCRRVKTDSRTSHIPLILLTARTSHDSMMEGLKTGADDYIPKPFSMEILSARVQNLIRLRREYQEYVQNRLALRPQEIPVSSIDEDFFNRLQIEIEKHISDPELNVETLSAVLQIGRTTLYRKIVALTGETPNQFIRSFRMQRAQQLFKANAGNVAEVSRMVGFTNPAYFSHCYKEKYFVLPSETREANHNHSSTSSPELVSVESPHPIRIHSFADEVREPEIILIVEDSSDVCEYIRDSLEIPYRVEIANDGPTGFQKAQELIPDLIISDIMMPGFDGFQLCRKLKAEVATSHIPIVLLTARASEASILNGFRTGVDDYITKPFNIDILLVRIQNILRLRAQLQDKRKRQMNLEPVEISVSSIDREFLNEVDRCIERHLSDFDFNVEVMARKLSIGRSTLYRKIQALTGQDPTHYIRSFRLNRATHLLKTTDRSITDIAFDVGFSSTPYFTRCFKEMFQRLPSGFRDKV